MDASTTAIARCCSSLKVRFHARPRASSPPACLGPPRASRRVPRPPSRVSCLVPPRVSSRVSSPRSARTHTAGGALPGVGCRPLPRPPARQPPGGDPPSPLSLSLSCLRGAIGRGAGRLEGAAVRLRGRAARFARRRRRRRRALEAVVPGVRRSPRARARARRVLASGPAGRAHFGPAAGAPPADFGPVWWGGVGACLQRVDVVDDQVHRAAPAQGASGSWPSPPPADAAVRYPPRRRRRHRRRGGRRRTREAPAAGASRAARRARRADHIASRTCATYLHEGTEERMRASVRARNRSGVGYGGKKGWLRAERV